MTRILAVLTSAVTTSVLLFRAVVPAYACTCAPATLEEHVAATESLVVGSITEVFTEPPLDPSTPDDLQHRVHVQFSAEEYLKGGGPGDFTVPTESYLYFTEDGTVGSSMSTCDIVGGGSVGKRYVFFFRSELVSAPGLCSGSTVLTDNPGAEDYLARIRAILQATPTPSPSPAPTAGPTAPAIVNPTSAPPVGLPRSGGDSGADSMDVFLAISGAAIALVAAGTVARRYR